MSDARARNHGERKPSRKKKPKLPDDALVWFNPRPDKQDVALLDAPSRDHMAALDRLFDTMSEQERLTVKYESSSGRWLSTLLEARNGSATMTHAMSVRGATAFDSLALIAYFHTEKFTDGWEADKTPVDTRWG